MQKYALYTHDTYHMHSYALYLVVNTRIYVVNIKMYMHINVVLRDENTLLINASKLACDITL